MIFHLTANVRTINGNALVILASTRTAALSIGRTAVPVYHACVVLGFLACLLTYHIDAFVARTSLRIAALAVGRAASRNRFTFMVACRLAGRTRQRDAFVVLARLRRTAIGILRTITGDGFALAAAARSRLAQRIAVRTPRRRFAVSRRTAVFDAFVLRIAPAVARRTRRRNATPVHRFIARFASRASRRGTSRAVRIMSGAGFARRSVRIISCFARNAVITTVTAARAGRTIRRSADTSSGRRKRATRFTAAFAVADLSVLTCRTRRVVRARFA